MIFLSGATRASDELVPRNETNDFSLSPEKTWSTQLFSETMPSAISPSQFAPPRMVFVRGFRSLILFRMARLAQVCSNVVEQPTTGNEYSSIAAHSSSHQDGVRRFNFEKVAKSRPRIVPNRSYSASLTASERAFPFDANAAARKHISPMSS